MEKKTIRTIIIILVVLIQVSFLAVVFPQHKVPSIALALVVSWTIISGFQQIFLWIILLGFFLDIVSFQTVGINIILLVMISYFVSFFSRRFLLEHRGWGTLVIVFFIIISTFFYYSVNVFIADSENALANISPENVGIQIIINLILFLIIYFPLRKIEEFLSFYDKRVKIK